MTNRERALAVLNYKKYDRLPIIDFGFNRNLLNTWRELGHIDDVDLINCGDGGEGQRRIEKKLGFDFNWQGCLEPIPNTGLFPMFEERLLEAYSNGTKKIIDRDGAIHIVKEGVGCIPSDAGTLLQGRAEWEEHYIHRLKYTDERIGASNQMSKKSEDPRGIHCGSLYGQIRNWLGVQGISYLYADDEELYDEIIDTVGELCFEVVKNSLETGASFDFGHYWEDICFKNGPLVNPKVFSKKVGIHYRRITDLLKQFGIYLISLDCDGLIDHLIPIWLENGVNIMFPIEVGTWMASIKPWREKYGKEIRGIGGMDKRVFSMDYRAVGQEIERLRPLVELGGYIPCPDHRMPPDAKWENVQYYCDKMRQVFG